jgi:hypothetical protein
MIEKNPFPHYVKLSSSTFYIGLVNIVFFSACAFFSWRAGGGYVTFIFLGFVCLGIFLTFIRGFVAFDEKSIYYRFIFSSYKMDWADVREVKTDPAAYGIVFIGENKHLAIMGSGFWAGKGRAEFMEKLLEKMRKQNLEIQVSGKMIFLRTGKNTKIKRL